MQNVSEEGWDGRNLKYIQKAATRKKYHCRKRPCPDGFFESFCDFSASTNSSPTIMACRSISCSVTEASRSFPNTCSAPLASISFYTSPWHISLSTSTSAASTALTDCSSGCFPNACEPRMRVLRRCPANKCRKGVAETPCKLLHVAMSALSYLDSEYHRHQRHMTQVYHNDEGSNYHHC